MQQGGHGTNGNGRRSRPRSAAPGSLLGVAALSKTSLLSIVGLRSLCGVSFMVFKAPALEVPPAESGPPGACPRVMA